MEMFYEGWNGPKILMWMSLLVNRGLEECLLPLEAFILLSTSKNYLNALRDGNTSEEGWGVHRSWWIENGEKKTVHKICYKQLISNRDLVDGMLSRI